MTTTCAATRTSRAEPSAATNGKGLPRKGFSADPEFPASRHMLRLPKAGTRFWLDVSTDSRVDRRVACPEPGLPHSPHSGSVSTADIPWGGVS
jgi:hypothetical protein